MKTSLIASLLLFSLQLSPALEAAVVSSSGEIFDFSLPMDPKSLTTQRGNATIVSENGAYAIRMEFDGDHNGPTLVLKSTVREPWDLTEYKGIEAEVTNVGPWAGEIMMRADNPSTAASADSKKIVHYISTSTAFGPGETKTIQLLFDNGDSSYVLNRAEVSAFVFIAPKGKESGAFLVKSLKVIK